MKNIIATIIFLFITTGLLAQQDIISKVSNKYYRTNGLTDVRKIDSITDKIADEFFDPKYNKLMDNSIERISDKMSYHEIMYSVAVPLEGESLRSSWGTSVRYFGLLKISWSNQPVPAKSIEELTGYTIDYIFALDNREDLVVEYVKNSELDGSFIYNPKDNLISFNILSKTKPERLRGTIIINLPIEERSKFARDFIESTKFDNGQETRTFNEATSSSGGSTRTTGGRTRGGG
ncbi:hypothetical protein [Chryseobacterium gallinarum]|nr:hypothetical protein [Chryseobacterium gallinarum]